MKIEIKKDEKANGNIYYKAFDKNGFIENCIYLKQPWDTEEHCIQRVEEMVKRGNYISTVKTFEI